MSFLESRTRAARQGFGRPVPRAEDPRLLTGAGCYSDDVNLPGQAYAALVRSPHAHARLRRIDAIAALTVPGVLAVLTGQDAARDGLQPIPHRPVPTNPHEVPLRSRDGSPFFVPPHLPLPVDRARFAARPSPWWSRRPRRSRATPPSAVVVDWEPLAAAVTAADATAAGAPLLWDEARSNVCVDSEAGDAAATEAASCAARPRLRRSCDRGDRG